MTKTLMFFGVCVLLYGCYVPYWEPEPYEQGQLAEVRVGETSREDILNLFGPNYVERGNSSIWIYADVRNLGTLLLPVWRGNAFVGDYQFLVIEFENDVVNNFEMVEKFPGGSSTGICLISGFDIKRRVRSTDDLILISSKRDDDRFAKQFKANNQSCSIYAYFEGFSGRIGVGAYRNVLIDSRTYLHASLEPGSHLIAAVYYYDRKAEDIRSYEFSCNTGEIIFFKMYNTTIWGIVPAIAQVDLATGSKAIVERSLILTP